MRTRFDYIRPSSVKEAVAAKLGHGDEAVYWAGGTDMMLQWKCGDRTPKYCIDLTFLDEMRGIEVRSGEIRIGALASLEDLERSAGAHNLLKTLSDITKLMCTPQTRTIATVGGNLCNASPAADLSPALVAMNASAVLVGADALRQVSMIDFFEGVNRTALREAEVLGEIRIPLPDDRRVVASYRRIDRTVVDIALVNASACLTIFGTGIVETCVIALGAVAPVIIRSPAAESVIAGKPVGDLDDATLAEAGAHAFADARPISDVRASATYRRDMVKVMVRRALSDCIDQFNE